MVWRRASARRPGPEFAGVAYCPDVLDLVAGDVEREHGHSDAVLLGHQAGLAVDHPLAEAANAYAAKAAGGIPGRMVLQP